MSGCQTNITQSWTIFTYQNLFQQGPYVGFDGTIDREVIWVERISLLNNCI